jgi:prepilin-type N-terminal cleavage/methylation domain-containing protein
MARDIKRGFTLAEFLVVIAIIGILLSIVLASINKSRENSKITQVLAQVKDLGVKVELYRSDTGQYPPDCRIPSPPNPTCTQENDPFLNSLGIPGWSGPYFTLYNVSHPWGGHISFTNDDVDGDGDFEQFIRLNDDKPGTNSSDNTSPVPTEAMLRIDSFLDDGSLTTGNVRGNGTGWVNISCTIGELCILHR